MNERNQFWQVPKLLKKWRSRPFSALFMSRKYIYIPQQAFSIKPNIFDKTTFSYRYSLLGNTKDLIFNWLENQTPEKCKERPETLRMHRSSWENRIGKVRGLVIFIVIIDKGPELKFICQFSSQDKTETSFFIFYLEKKKYVLTLSQVSIP